MEPAGPRQEALNQVGAFVEEHHCRTEDEVAQVASGALARRPAGRDAGLAADRHGLCSGLLYVLIDLSDVSENVLWEIEEMTRGFGQKCVFVGRHDLVAWLADPPRPGRARTKNACSDSSTDTRCSHTPPTAAESDGSRARCAPSS